LIIAGTSVAVSDISQDLEQVFKILGVEVSLDCCQEKVNTEPVKIEIVIDLESEVQDKEYVTKYEDCKKRQEADEFNMQEVENNEEGCKQKCPVCRKMVTYLDRHVQTAHKDVKGRCDVCKKIVLKGFKKHRASCNICPRCGYTNPRKQRLMMHMETFHNRPDGLKEYFEFPSFDNTFDTIMKKSTDDARNDPMASCHICDKKFKVEGNLMNHIRIFHERKIFDCIVHEKEGKLKEKVDI
jgi:hypothetical protein